MSCYFVAQIRIEDMAEYKKYLDRCDEVFAQFNGRYLAVDPNPIVLEGQSQYDRVVMIEFPTEEDLRSWYESPQYQQILKYRLGAGSCDTLLVKGNDK